MEITVRGKNIQVTDSLREYAEKKVGKLAKYFDDVQKAQVTMQVLKDDHVVEVTIPFNGMILRGEEVTEDMYASVDLVTEKIERQIHKHKTKLYRKLRNQGLKDLINQDKNKEEEEEEEFRIVRTKKFSLKPMLVEEAVMQMNLVGHSFFVFTNAETEDINVVYRRKDGNYGLIEPDF